MKRNRKDTGKLFGYAATALCAAGLLWPVIVSDAQKTGAVNPARLEIAAITISASLCLLFILALCRDIRFRFTSTDGWFAAFTGYWFFRYFTTGSHCPTHALLLVLLTGVYFAIRLLVSSDRTSRSIVFLCLCLIGITESVWGLAQLSGFLPSYHALYRFTGSLFNPGPYCGMLAILLPLALYLGLRKPSHPLIAHTGLICSTAVIILLPAGMSRSAWIAALAGCGWVLWKHGSLASAIRNFFRLKRRYFLPVAFLCLLLLCGIGTGMYALKKDSADGRLLMWKVSGMAVEEAPWTGQGPGSFAGAYGKAQASYFTNQPHSSQEEYVAGCPEYGFNEYLQITTELGIIGLLLFAGTVLSAFRQACEQHQAGIAGSLIAFAVFAFFSYPFSVLPLSLLFVVFIALCPPPAESHYPPIIPRTIILLITGACLYAGNGLLKKAAHLRTWQEEKRYFDMEIYEGTVEEYRRLYPALKEFAPFLFEYGQCLAKTGQYEESITVLSEGALRSADPMFYNIIGRNEQALGHYEAAEKAFLRAYRTVPHRLYPLYLLAELYISTGQYEKAADVIRKALAQKPKIMSPAIEEMQHKLKKLYEQIPS